jgi:hypothetical protein
MMLLLLHRHSFVSSVSVMIHNLPAALFVLIVVMCFSGCSRERDIYDVEGVLSYQGKPLPEVELLMSPADGRRGSSTTTDKKGHFRMQYTATQEGVPVGENIVHIRYWPEDPNQGQAYLEGRLKIEGMIGEVLKKYGDRTTSAERLTVDHDMTGLQLDLQ